MNKFIITQGLLNYFIVLRVEKVEPLLIFLDNIVLLLMLLLDKHLRPILQLLYITKEKLFTFYLKRSII